MFGVQINGELLYDFEHGGEACEILTGAPMFRPGWIPYLKAEVLADRVSGLLENAGRKRA